MVRERVMEVLAGSGGDRGSVVMVTVGALGVRGVSTDPDAMHSSCTFCVTLS